MGRCAIEGHFMTEIALSRCESADSQGDAVCALFTDEL